MDETDPDDTGGFRGMASDEIVAYDAAITIKDIEAVKVAMILRRIFLNELDQARIARLDRDGEAIQAVFDRVGLGLGLDGHAGAAQKPPS